MAYAAKYFENNPVNIYCICGDGEFSEGSCWEALQFAHLYKLNNLITIIDVNRLGQSEEAPYKHDMVFLKKRLDGFGVNTLKIDGHDLSAIIDSFQKATKTKEKPTVILAKTFKGKDCSEEVIPQFSY